MADEGPTTVATIVAKFKGDEDDVLAKVETVKAAVDELTATDTTITVKANTAEAMAKLSAVEVAQEKLSNAVARTQIAEARLTEVEKSGASSATRVASARQAVVLATQSQRDASIALTEALVAEQAVEGDVESATTKAGGAAERGAGQMQLMAGAAVAVIALLGPLAAVTAAGVGGFVGLGTAGFLAVKGIQQQMADGTETGIAYQDGLQTLQYVLNSLEKTAAVSFLSSFKEVEQDIAGDLPSLNSEVEQFTGYLGDAAKTAVPAIIDGLKIANPLFVDGAKYVDRLATSFAQWTADGGLKKFVTYAEAELPKVEDTVNSLASGVASLGHTFSTEGNGILATLADLGKASTLVDHLSQSVDNLTSSQDGASKSGDVWGAIIKQQLTPGASFAATMTGIGDGLDWVNGLFNQNATAAKKSGDQQKDSKVQYDAATQALQKQGDAATLLTDALKILNGGTLNVAEANTGLAAATNSTLDSFKQNGKVVDGNTAAAVANQQALQQQVESAQTLAEAIGRQTGSTGMATDSLRNSKQAMEDTLQSQGLLTDSVKAYIDEIFQIPASVPPTKLDVDTAAAKTKIADLAAFIAQKIPTNIRLGVRVDTSGNAAGGTIGRAEGGSIGLASGGTSGTVYGPGSSTSDSILTRLSAGEEVIKASSAQKVRPLLKALNRDPDATMSALASSGSGGAVMAYLSADDRRLLRDAISRPAVVALDDGTLAQASNRGTSAAASLGAN